MITENKIGIPSPFWVLQSRALYETTRICLPDDPQTLPAIRVGQRYYSFFRTTTTADDILKLLVRFCDRNHAAALTKIPKGYGLWLEEPTARPLNLVSSQTSAPELSKCYYLNDQKHYHPLRLMVPNLDLPVLGIRFKQRYYSIFCKELDIINVLDIVSQLAGWGNESVLIHHRNSYMICILEPDAQPK